MLKIFIWGTGCIANRILTECSILDEYDVLGFIDNDSNKQGKIFFEKIIYAPDILLKKKADKVIILTNEYWAIHQQIIEELNIKDIIIENKYFFYKQTLLNRYKETDDLEIKQVISYIHNNDLQVFNYDFTQKYESMDITVLYDEGCGLFYVVHQGKKMYFARKLNTKEAVKKYYISILLEQDKKSPHKYLDKDFQVYDGDIVVDVGVAEGNFALEVIEKASKIYLFETDEDWIEALEWTFKEYAEKVTIINKFITSLDEGKYAKLDTCINEPVNFIKMDIEGNEWDALLGAKRLINQSKKLRCAICAYHSDYDEILIREVLTSLGLKCFATSGYMWYPFRARTNYTSTKLCRGIVRAIK